MKFTVVVTRRAERDMQNIAAWWAEHRSAEQADRWLTEIHQKIRGLAASANECPHAPESGDFSQDPHMLLFGIGRRPTHRVIFSIVDDLVLVLTVRHLAQDELREGDLD